MTAVPADTLQGEVEGTRPLRMREGRVSIRGWCVVRGAAIPPSVRLAAGSVILPMTSRLARPDVARTLPEELSAANSGFAIEGVLPSGVHLATFEAQLADGSWRPFKVLSLAVDPPPFVAAIDEPISQGLFRDRVYVGGWALVPDEEIRELTLRYGHREVSCTIGLPRTDVPSRFPDSPHAPRSGFRTRAPLVAGHGSARLRARLAGGRTKLAPSPATFSIASDPDHEPELQLDAPRLELPGYEQRLVDTPDKTDRPLNLLFLLYGNFTSNSALQVAALANELGAQGHACVVAVPREPETIRHHVTPRFQAVSFAQIASQSGLFSDGRGPDIVHAWTTRECVRQAAEDVCRRHHARLVVQLEDNEQELLAQQLGRPFAELAGLPDPELDRLVSPDLSHPRRSREFLQAADAVTVIVDRLREFVPAGKLCATIWPAADARYFFPRPVPTEFRRLLVPDEQQATILFYHGNAHAANAGEMRALYESVLRLNESGHPTTLIRAGLDAVDFLGPLAEAVRPHVLELGQILNHRHLPPLMALADIFVQPGEPGPFNDYRFPSKLPEFFALGRPVILPRTNLGVSVRHGVDAYVLERADAAGIAAAVRALRADRALSERLGRGAAEFAASRLSWSRSASALASLYLSLARS